MNKLRYWSFLFIVFTALFAPLWAADDPPQLQEGYFRLQGQLDGHGKNGFETDYVVRDVYLPSGVAKFGFESGPCVAGLYSSWTTTCLCDGVRCGTITCSTPEMTLCCQRCICMCGHVECQPE